MLPWFIFAVWCLWAVACAAEDARRGVPEGRRSGVSIFPVIPLFPLACWGVARLIDRAAAPYGTVLVGAAHALFAASLIVSLSRGWRPENDRV